MRLWCTICLTVGAHVVHIVGTEAEALMPGLDHHPNAMSAHTLAAERLLLAQLKELLADCDEANAREDRNVIPGVSMARARQVISIMDRPYRSDGAEQAMMTRLSAFISGDA
jgi:hypothetical protein